jgi:hypothetical protein
MAHFGYNPLWTGILPQDPPHPVIIRPHSGFNRQCVGAIYGMATWQLLASDLSVGSAARET